jgi:hypothetical protein
MAAWGAIQRILAAIDRFIAFLKAVRGGNAGPAFAQALAAAAIAVIEFVSQFLLRKIAGAASKIAGKIKAIAQKIGQRLMKVMKKVGAAVKKGVAKVKRGATKLKEKVFGKKKKKTKEEEKQDKQKRLDDAVRVLQPKIMALVGRHASSLRLKAQLLIWRVQHRLSKLWIERSGERINVKAQVNPVADVVRNVFTPQQLHALLHRIGEAIKKRPDVQAKVQRIADARARGEGKDKDGTPRQAESAATEAAALSAKDGSKESVVQQPRLKPEYIQMGDQKVTQQQMFHPGPGAVKVHGVGTGHYDPAVIDALQEMERAGLKPEVIRQGVYNLLQNKPVGPEFAGHAKAAGQVAAISRLMFVVEGARDSSAFATSFMAWETAGKNGTPLKDVVSTLNPMSPSGAVPTARNTRVPRETLGDTERVNVDAMLESTMLNVIRYLETLMKAEQPMFTNDAECEVFCREKLEQHLMAKLEALLL